MSPAQLAREPYCIHTGTGPMQPASMCVDCKDGPTLAKWRAYWAEHPDLIPDWAPSRQRRPT